jgi:hypothetical protein
VVGQAENFLALTLSAGAKNRQKPFVAHFDRANRLKSFAVLNELASYHAALPPTDPRLYEISWLLARGNRNPQHVCAPSHAR